MTGTNTPRTLEASKTIVLNEFISGQWTFGSLLAVKYCTANTK